MLPASAVSRGFGRLFQLTDMKMPLRKPPRLENCLEPLGLVKTIRQFLRQAQVAPARTDFGSVLPVATRSIPLGIKW